MERNLLSLKTNLKKKKKIEFNHEFNSILLTDFIIFFTFGFEIFYFYTK